MGVISQYLHGLLANQVEDNGIVVWFDPEGHVTWVTLALTAGVPIELVQKVTGHKTVDIVLKHYFQPGREEFRRALQSAMPKLLTSGEKTPKEEILTICAKATGKTWKKDMARIVELANQI